MKYKLAKKIIVLMIMASFLVLNFSMYSMAQATNFTSINIGDYVIIDGYHELLQKISDTEVLSRDIVSFSNWNTIKSIADSKISNFSDVAINSRLLTSNEARSLDRNLIIDNSSEWWLEDSDIHDADCIRVGGNSNSALKTDIMGLRYVLELKPDIYVVAGDGSVENPYIISNENIIKIDSLKGINIGEYVKIVGNTELFQKIGFNKLLYHSPNMTMKYYNASDEANNFYANVAEYSYFSRLLTSTEAENLQPYFNSFNIAKAWLYDRPYYDRVYYTSDITGGVNYTNSTSYKYKCKPVLFLNEDLIIMSGSGSQINPYIISNNNIPVIDITTADNQILSENEGHNQLNISGTIKDDDIGDNLIVKYSIEDSSGIPLTAHDNVIVQSNIIGDGTDQNFNNLTITIDNTIPEGVNTLKIWTEDNKGGKSSVVTRNIIVDKSGPTVLTTKKMVVSLMSLLKIDISATDPANPLDDVPIIYNLTDDTTGEEIHISNAGSIFIHPSTHESFKEGNTIKVSITTTDAVGNATPSAIDIKIDSTGCTNPNDL